MIGKVFLAAKAILKIAKLRRAAAELIDVVRAVQALVGYYEKAKLDGKITPEETERLMKEVAKTAREGQEAIDVIRELV